MDSGYWERDIRSRREDLERARKALSDAERRGAPQSERYTLSENVRTITEGLDRAIDGSARDAARERARRRDRR
ncbi:hypothetical protein ACIGB8_28695 [Promicromonospora sukumoe]|uniref:hypothetical protein n=1 Tax=Promicromonospora sukumoe TaxID=88382 RepID=UPI0037CC6DBD